MKLDLQRMSEPWTSLPLIGREAELHGMRRALAAATRGACTFRVVAGDHGVGKTRLLQATRDLAATQGFSVVRATAYQSDVSVPYAVIADALGPLVAGLDPGAIRTLTRGADAELARIIPALGTGGERAGPAGDDGDLTPRLRWHTAQLLSRLSGKQPILLTIDNAHWTDPSSAALLHFVLRHAPEARLMIAAAFTPLEAEATSPLRTMAKAAAGMPGFEQLTLSPLSRADVLALVRQRFAVDEAQVSAFATFLHDRTLGNPFFVEETLKTLIERGTLRLVNERWIGWDVDDIDVPATIREVLLDRVGALSPAARDVADLAAVAGFRASHTLLVEASALLEPGFNAAIADLRRASVITEREEGPEIYYDLTHPLLQRTLYEEINAARRRELHARIAGILERQLGAEAERQATALAYHFVRANAPALAPKSIRYLLRAGQDALGVHADRESVRYLQHALDLIDRAYPAAGEYPDLPRLVEDLARARQRLGEYDLSRTLWLRARELAQSSGDRAALARLERRIGMLTFWSGHPQLALDHYDAALEHARAAQRRDLEVRALVTKGLGMMAVGKPDEAKQNLSSALAIAQDLGDLELRAWVHHALVVVYSYAGPANQARDLAQRLLADAQAVGDRDLAWAAHHSTAALACFTADAESVQRHVAEADRIARELHSPALSAMIAEVAIEYASAKGEWAEGLALAERAIPIARAMSPRSLLPRLLVWAGSIRLNRDEIEQSKACFDEAWELSRAGVADSTGADLNAVIVAHIGQASYYLTIRDWMTAIEFAERGIAIADRHGMTSWTLHRLLPMLAESALWVGDFSLAEEAAKRLRADSARFDHRLGEAWAFTVEQLIGRWRDNTPGVIERLQAAAEQLDQVPFVFHAARLRRHIARLLSFDGDRDGAARELRQAHDVFLRLGAALELRLAREAMRQLGLRPPQQTLVQGGTLTQREREIAQLVAARKTNKEIARALDISARTVGTHLSNVFQKLGVDSRGALVDLVREHPGLQSKQSSGLT
jgi:DNA-binding CsgD family transcriptional regulator